MLQVLGNEKIYIVALNFKVAQQRVRKEHS